MTLEKLLSILCAKGWKPFWWKDIKRVNNEWWFVCFVHKSKKRPWLSEVSHRELVSKESGLWQFVCENALYSYTNCVWKGCEWPVVADYIEPQSYKYRLIESTLCDEDKLEEFLLDNIKVEW